MERQQLRRIRIEGGGLTFAVMELELIEPELWQQDHPPPTTAFADAIIKIVRA